MSAPLPLRQFDATDPEQLRTWIADLRDRCDTDDQAFEQITAVIGHLGREYQKVAAALKAKGRGQRGGGSEAYGRQATIPWAEAAEARIGEEPSSETSADEQDAAPSERRRGHRQPFPASWSRERVELPVHPTSAPARSAARTRSASGTRSARSSRSAPRSCTSSSTPARSLPAPTATPAS